MDTELRIADERLGRFREESAIPDIDTSDPTIYLNPALSFLEFNRRVLHLARAVETPLLERLRFLTICSTNLDEFFEIRVAGRKERQALGISHPEPDGLSLPETLKRISEVAHGFVREQYRVLQEELLPALREAGIRVLRRASWDDAQKRWVREFFDREVLPVLTPKGLDPAHPFPRILNKSLNFIVSLEGTDAFGRGSRFAVVQVPRSLPRVIPVPAEFAGGVHDFVLLSSIVHEHVEQLFPGMTITGCHQFRVTRNSDLWVDEEDIEDLLDALKGELGSRNYAAAVRLELAESCPGEIADFLLQEFELTRDDLYQVDGPVNLNRLAAIYDQVTRPDLKYPPFIPGSDYDPDKGPDIFRLINQGDILLHHPYQSFRPVVELVTQAASDPDVLAIKQTLYRTDVQSQMARALIDAAKAGKDVTAVVELRARFEEAANIDLATRLQEVGANVVYGVVGFKTHAKMLLVVRREAGRLRSYVHLGTGNYHEKTAQLYTDFGLLTCDQQIGEDVHKLFMQLTGLGKVNNIRKILHAPFTLEKTLLELIDGEAEQAAAGRPARIIARMNALSDTRVIRALYRASQAGVSIDLIVRGVCCLRPGVRGVSDNIRVRSIVGRFLEHSRVFHFHAGGQGLTYCSSADWMPRNLYRRVETCFPIAVPALQERVIDEGLMTYLDDNCEAWILQPDGGYEKCEPIGETPRAAQQMLLRKHAAQRMVNSNPTV
jgi:polyphosphate kinase